MAEDLRGKIALVTGSAKRIGREIVLALAREGAGVVIHYRRSEEEADSLWNELAHHGVSSWVVRADFEKLDEVESLVPRAIQEAGRLDILINNASDFPVETLDNLTFDSLTRNIQINAWAPFALGRSFAQHVERGKIVNLIDSRTADFDWSHAGYILAKHLLLVLTRMTALQYAPNITVNGVSPGLILPPPDKDESYVERLVGTVPLKKHGGPEDVVEAVIYLLKSDFLTGTVIQVDGGRHLKEYQSGQNRYQ